MIPSGFPTEWLAFKQEKVRQYSRVCANERLVAALQFRSLHSLRDCHTNHYSLLTVIVIPGRCLSLGPRGAYGAPNSWDQ